MPENHKSFGTWYIAVALPNGKKATVPVKWAKCKADAEGRKGIVAKLAFDLRSAGREDLVRRACRRAANATEEDLLGIVQLVHGLVNGTETASVALPPSDAAEASPSVGAWTVRRFGEYWTSNDLADESGGNVRRIKHEDNVGRLEKHVYPIVFQGRRVEDLPIGEFTKAHAKHIVRQPTLPAGSRNHVGVMLKRMFRLAYEECEVISENPLRDWKPPPKNPPKQGAYLYPCEEAALMACADVPLVRRVFFGFAAREGIRREKIVNLKWDRIALTGHGRRGVAMVPGRPNKPGVHWVLDEGTAEALRRWRRICPSTSWVFPAEALPRFRRYRSGMPLSVHHFADDLRDSLKVAGVTRTDLFDPEEGFRHLVGHDLRATYVTLARAAGESDSVIRQRTRHTTTGMIDRYDHAVGIHSQLNSGMLVPLHQAIPELAEMEPSKEWREAGSNG